jgi:hypothetical protein
MSKSKKKRTKKYAGVDSKIAKSSENVVRVHKVAAVARSDRAQWFHDHRTFLRRWTIAVVVFAVIAFLIIEAIIAMSH